MTKFGQVVALDEEKGTVRIRFNRPDACAKCGACGGAQGSSSLDVKADCQLGQWVRVEMPEGRFLQATAMAYALPLAGLLAGLFLGNTLGGGADLPTLLGGGVGLALTLGILFLNERRIAGKPEWTPRVTAVYDACPTTDEIGCGGVPPQR